MTGGQEINILKLENASLKKKTLLAETELAIIKGIGNNSPEMKALQAKVNELESTLSSAQDINDNHQRYNGKLQLRVSEVEKDNKILSKQISDYIKNHEDKFRKAGL